MYLLSILLIQEKRKAKKFQLWAKKNPEKAAEALKLSGAKKADGKKTDEKNKDNKKKD